MNISAALERLDPKNDDHWTSDGLPRVDAVCAVLGASVTRKQITDAAPTLRRDGASELPAPPPQPSLSEAGGELFRQEPKDEDAAPITAPVGGAPDEPRSKPTETSEERAPLDLRALSDLLSDVDASHMVAALCYPLDEVVGMQPNQVFADSSLVDRAVIEFTRQSDVLVNLRSRLDEKIKDVSRRVQLLSRVQQKTGKKPAQKAAEAIQTYLAAQRRSRMERADRARRFLTAGTSADDVAKELRSSAPIDVAMQQRKKKPGQGRPVYPRSVPTHAGA